MTYCKTKTSMTETEKIWFRDPQAALFNPDVAARIIPERGAPLAEQLNAVMRFSIYLGILLSLFHRSLLPLIYISAVSMVLTVALNYHDNQKESKVNEMMEKLNVVRDDFGEFCSAPTKANPFMNVLPTDFPNRPQACDVTQPEIQKVMEQSFADKLYRNSDDIYGRETSSRQFYTMPVSTIPNKQVEFAEWLYLNDDIDGVCRGGDALACEGGMRRQRE